jgi:hypothetical protein
VIGRAVISRAFWLVVWISSWPCRILLVFFISHRMDFSPIFLRLEKQLGFHINCCFKVE